ISWAAYGVNRGIYRLLDGFARHGAKASVMTNAIIAERTPEAVKAVADGGHEVLSHSYAMDVIPALMSDEEERKNIARCTELLETGWGVKGRGWPPPARTRRREPPPPPRRGGLSWVGRLIQPRPPLLGGRRNPPHRGDPAVDRRQRHAVHEIRQHATDDVGVV